MLPTKPCRGVEDWDLANCGGAAQSIWNYSLQAMLKENKPRTEFGMAINPTLRRGQHQVRVPG